ncbi:MAG: ABC transporter substrate-binding protein [Betaproteobacteria bacterium]
MTRKMRRVLAFSIAALLVLGMASGAVLAKKTTIVHWQHHSPARKEMVEAFAAEFMEKNPDIEIQIESIPETDYFQKLLPALAAGSGPDTFQIPAGQVSSYAVTGVLQPISPKVATAAQIEADFVPSAIKRLKVGDNYYGFPVDTQTIVLFYNPQLFKEAGLDPAKPPQTWAELIEYAKAMTRRDASGVTTRMGVATGGYGPVLASLMLQNGASLWNNETDLPDFSSPATIEALKFATDLVTTYKVEDRQMGSRWNAFRQSKLGMVFAHPAMIGSFRATVPDLVFNIAQIPAPKPGGSRTTLLASWAYVVSKKAPSEAASKWVAYLTSADAQKQWITKTGDLPTRKALLDLPEYKNDPLLGPCMESMKNSVPVPWTTRRLDDELPRQAYERVILKDESPAQAMKWLSEEAVKAEKEQRALAQP